MYEYYASFLDAFWYFLLYLTPEKFHFLYLSLLQLYFSRRNFFLSENDCSVLKLRNWKLKCTYRRNAKADGIQKFDCRIGRLSIHDSRIYWLSWLLPCSPSFFFALSRDVDSYLRLDAVATCDSRILAGWIKGDAKCNSS